MTATIATTPTATNVLVALGQSDNGALAWEALREEVPSAHRAMRSLTSHRLITDEIQDGWIEDANGRWTFLPHRVIRLTPAGWGVYTQRVG